MSPFRYALALPTFVVLLAAVSVARAQGVPANEPWYEQNPLPQGMTEEEMQRRHEIGLGFSPTPPPPGPVRNVAEFERSEAVLIRYPLGITLQLVAALSEQLRVITIVATQGLEDQAASAFQGAGVNMDNVEFLRAPTDSYWTRDYGPFYIADGNGDIGIVDFIYNRPRPSDDAIPAALAAYLDVPFYAMDLVHTGGNYMTDSRGVSASTDLVWEENGFNQTLVLDRMLDYLGVETYHVTIDPQDTYLKHIDTWAKFLDVDKVLIAEVPPSDPHYDEHEAVAAYFASQTSAYGTPYQVFRVYTPGGEPYTNALVVNERVYVPVVNSPWDDEALALYEAAMPGYEVLPFTGSWLSTDALHCRVKEVADNEMLYLRHDPVAGEVPYQPEIALDVDIVPYSGAPLLEDELFLFYRVDGGPYDALPLQHAGGDTYTASLPVPPGGDVQIDYYFSAADASGRTEHFPLVGPDGPRSFYVLPSAGACEQELSAMLDDPAPAPGDVITFTTTVTNHDDSPAPLDLWLDADGPVDRRIHLAAGTLPAGATVTRNVRVRVPANAPGGTYALDLHIGDYPDDACDTARFTIHVSAPTAIAGGGATFEATVEGADFFAAATSAAPAVVSPNPFARHAVITYEVAASAEVRLAVYDVLGREVAVLADGHR
ncbi:MAG TPA: agmatine deiminase family protein, partial [Rubricoccaceae bacterium]|nr:agmatine deiminase family protein [Rubricoccaceae bacterium]